MVIADLAFDLALDLGLQLRELSLFRQQQQNLFHARHYRHGFQDVLQFFALGSGQRRGHVGQA